MKLAFPFHDVRARMVLDRLYRSANHDRWRFLRRIPEFFLSYFHHRDLTRAFQEKLLRDAYIPISPEQGALLYLTARAIHAKRIVEFGTSFGLSTIYLAAAVKDSGGGIVIGSEMEKHKFDQANAHLKEAGLDSFVEIRFGDALETFQSIEGPIDLLLLDGWKDLYLPVLKMLQPKLRPGAVVFADNIFTFRKALKPYVDYMQSETNGFSSATLPLDDGFELSVKT